MKLLDQIKNSQKKPKELVVYLSRAALKDSELLTSWKDSIGAGNDAEKGICMEVLEFVTQEKPELAKPLLESVISYINYKAPKVKWEAARVMSNVAAKFPDEVAKAVPNLLLNTNDVGTVVRWSAALALGEIAKSNAKIRISLLVEIDKILKKEKSSGVKNVYLKALKSIK